MKNVNVKRLLCMLFLIATVVGGKYIASQGVLAEETDAKTEATQTAAAKKTTEEKKEVAKPVTSSDAGGGSSGATSSGGVSKPSGASNSGSTSGTSSSDTSNKTGSSDSTDGKAEATKAPQGEATKAPQPEKTQAPTQTSSSEQETKAPSGTPSPTSTSTATATATKTPGASGATESPKASDKPQQTGSQQTQTPGATNTDKPSGSGGTSTGTPDTNLKLPEKDKIQQELMEQVSREKLDMKQNLVSSARKDFKTQYVGDLENSVGNLNANQSGGTGTGGSAETNLHQGNALYLDQLKEEYKLVFKEDFADVMKEIQLDFEKANQVPESMWTKVDSIQDDSVQDSSIQENSIQENPVQDDSSQDDSETDSIVENCPYDNWQDILAIYAYRQLNAGADEVVLNADSKEALASLFNEMNSVSINEEETDEKEKVTYQNRHIGDYLEEKKATLSQKKYESLKEQLEFYTSTDCSILCAAVSGSEALLQQSLGEDISPTRAKVVAAAYSLVGKINYFWGGKYNALGWNDRWGSIQKVSAAGSDDSGRSESYGMDCSGFVTWAFINGFEEVDLGSQVGNGTASQWAVSEPIEEADAQPGDLVFLKTPSSGGINHVGIIIGQKENGDWIVAHCNASDDTVSIDEAYSVGFRYIRRPDLYQLEETQSNLEQAEEDE